MGGRNRRGTAYGFFNLVSGIAMLAASAAAGLLWDRFAALALMGFTRKAPPRHAGGNP